MAQRPKLTPQVIEKVCEGLRFGAYFESSCRYAGIAPQTAYQWLALAKEEAERQEKPPDSRPDRNKRYKPGMMDFAEAVSRVGAEREVALSGVVLRAATGRNDANGNPVVPGDWKAAAWLLERRFPNNWAQQQKVEAKVEHTLSETIVSMVSQMRDSMLGQRAALPGAVIEVEADDMADDKT